MAEEGKQVEREVAQLLDGFVELIGGIADLAETAAGEDTDAVAAVGLYAPALREQSKNMAGELRAAFDAAPRETQAVAEQLVRVGAGKVLLGSAQERLAEGGRFLGGIGAKLLANLSKIITELKKFFEALWELLGKTPKWWAWVDLILDQLLMGLLKVLGGILGFDIGRLAEEMSMDEVHSLRERSVLRAARGEGSEES